MAEREPNRGPPGDLPRPASRQSGATLDTLAELVGLKPEFLRDVARRLAEDAQVQMLTALYQFETEEVGQVHSDNGWTSKALSASSGASAPGSVPPPESQQAAPVATPPPPKGEGSNA